MKDCQFGVSPVNYSDSDLGRDDLGRYDTKPFSMYNPRAATPMSGSRVKTMAGVVRRIIQTSKAPSAVGAYRYK